MLILKKLSLLVLLICCLCLVPTPAKAAPTDTSNLAISTITGFLNPENAAIRNDLLELLKDSQHRQELIDYIEATRPVIEKYKGYFDTASNVAIWSEENIPIIGHLIGNVAISVTNYFYQQELQELATTEVAQKFAELRQSGINIEIDIFQRALSNYVLNDGIDLSLIMNLQEIINERLEVHNFLKSIIESSDLEYNIIDDGNIIPKLDTRINFNK
ncbi:transposase [Megamonas funiformis]|uniref:transposase n=1 Tax=Megamonas funiformis TaxID=437897 RepID=UPI0022E4B966|nr:transposase [Megamonas funiformis]